MPGINETDPELMKRLGDALRDQPDDYRPRTHHLLPDGSPKFINRLILETSPYLLQHAHNPVNWFPWGDEAFELAKRHDKPVLLSVGYSTCHWCHVMERESFEDEEIAKYINENYIAIKVDREERPDVDDVYMKAVQMMTGRGGWPMTVLLTADKQPFFGGTYFPARDGDRGTRHGFLTILKHLRAEFDNDRDGLVARAQEISAHIATLSTPQPASDVPASALIKQTAALLARQFDHTWGGFGYAPKFPRPVSLELLLRYHRRTGDQDALNMVTHTLDKMASGGLYDQIGGGFHRYSTDARWLVPHFEKMLYDNAQLVPVYLSAFQLTGESRFADTARDTLRYVAREMTSPHGAFYSATDADSPTPGGHEEEGYFFTWTPAELNTTLEPELAATARAYYDVTEDGNFEGRSIPHRPRADQEVAKELSLEVGDLLQSVAAIRSSLYEARLKRPPPLRDDKILTSWNGLMISAFAQAALVLNDVGYAERAQKAASFVLDKMRGNDGRLHRSYKNNQARHNAFLDDYAFLTQGLLDLFEATSEPRWIEEAIALQRTLDQHYWDDDNGGYFMTADDHEALLARDKPTYDGAEPSGNSVALLNLLRLAEFTTDHAYRKRAERGLIAFGTQLGQSPIASPKLLSALDYYLDTPLEVFIVTANAGADSEPLLRAFRQTFLPNRAFARVAQHKVAALTALLPALEGKDIVDGKSTAYVCEQGRCERPTSDPAVFETQLAKVVPLSP